MIVLNKHPQLIKKILMVLEEIDDVKVNISGMTFFKNLTSNSASCNLFLKNFPNGLNFLLYQCNHFKN
jgi:hypothetical protein